MFHIQRQCGGLAHTLSRLARGAASRRETLEATIGRAGPEGPDGEAVAHLALARQAETRACGLARDIQTLTRRVSHDVLALAGPDLATRRMLFDFIVEELARREPGDLRRIRPVRAALENDDLLAFAGVSMKNWPASRERMKSLIPSRGKPAFYTGYRAPRPRTGEAGTGFARSWEANSTR